MSGFHDAEVKPPLKTGDVSDSHAASQFGAAGLTEWVREESYAVFRLRGSLPLSDAIHQVTSAIALARKEGIRNLMVVMTESTGYESPRLGARYSFIREWALAAGGLVRVAVVVRTEFIEPQRFGIMVAANAGMIANVFDAESEALSWLLKLK